MAGTAIVEEIISILVAGISGIATGIGDGIKALVDSVFFTTTTSGGRPDNATAKARSPRTKGSQWWHR